MHFANSYEFIHFFDCFLKPPQIHLNKIIIPAQNIGVFPGHPLNSSSKPIFLDNCLLIFDKVSKSKRTIYEYIGDPACDGFKPAKTIIDILQSPEPPGNETRVLHLEGVLEEPFSWVDWTIECKNFIFEI